MSDDFRWNKDNESVVVPSTQGIAVYPNTGGGITIRQQKHWDEEEDHIIAFPLEYAPAIVAAIQQAARETGRD